MRVQMECIEYDENSTKRVPLELRGVYVGDFSFGLYSKWYKHQGKSFPFALIGNFVIGLLESRFNVRLFNKEDIESFKESFDKDIAIWFEEYMKNDIK